MKKWLKIMVFFILALCLCVGAVSAEEPDFSKAVEVRSKQEVVKLLQSPFRQKFL